MAMASQSCKTNNAFSMSPEPRAMSNIDFERFPGPVVDWISGNWLGECRSREFVALRSARSTDRMTASCNQRVVVKVENPV